MNSIEYDLRFFRAGLALLDKYLLSDDLYWPPPEAAPQGEPPYQSLTLGSISLARRRLENRNCTDAQRAEITKLDLYRDQLFTHWRLAWEKKAEQEIRARLNQWKNFVADYLENPGAFHDSFLTEARSRAMIDLLLPDLPPGEKTTNLKEALLGLDAALRTHWHPGPFNWPAEIERSFSETPFWYFYGTLDSAKTSE